jgi:hypothetical protein
VRSVVRIYPGPPYSAAGTHMWGCSSVGRAPALQAGGQRFDPVQLHQRFSAKLIRCFQIAARLMLLIQPDADLETGWSGLWTWPEGFLTASGRAVRETDETVWMFDNEIDWVIAHRAQVPRTDCREAAGRTFVAMTRIQGRAHCRVATVRCRGECKCSM